MQMLYIYVLCASCGSSQCCILHDLQFVNAGRDAQSDNLWQCDRNYTHPLWFFSAVLVSASSRLLKLVHQSPFLSHVSVNCPCCIHQETAGIFQSSRKQHSGTCCRPKPKLLTITEMVNVTNISQHAHKINHIYPCRCCIFISCVHPVAVLNAAFCMTCSLLMLVEMPSQITCGSAIETTHIHYGSFRLFLSQLLQGF